MYKTRRCEFVMRADGKGLSVQVVQTGQTVTITPGERFYLTLPHSVVQHLFNKSETPEQVIDRQVH
jgi:hypothetical protein